MQKNRRAPSSRSRPSTRARATSPLPSAADGEARRFFCIPNPNPNRQQSHSDTPSRFVLSYRYNTGVSHTTDGPRASRLACMWMMDATYGYAGYAKHGYSTWLCRIWLRQRQTNGWRDRQTDTIVNTCHTYRKIRGRVMQSV